MRIGLCYVCRLTPIHSWTVFLVAVEYFQEESLWVLPRCRTCTGLKRNENSMSGRNGDRSRFHRQRRAKLHDRTRIRELRKTVTAQEAGSGAKVRIKTGLMLLPDTGRKYDSKSSGISDGSEIR